MEEIKEEEKWKAHEDARTLVEYQKLLKDSQRMKKAKTVLEEQQDEIKKALNNYNKK